MRITLDDVKITAGMARLYLSDEELVSLQVGLDQILTYSAQLQEVDVTGVQPMTHMVTLQCPLRSDEVSGQLTLEEALGNAPRREASFFAVPTILTKDEG